MWCGILAQLGHDLGQFGWQHVARIHRDHLPQLHRRTAQVGQPLGHLADIAGGQQHVAHAGPLAIGQPPRALGHHSARDAARQPPELAQPRQPAPRHCASAALSLRSRSHSVTIRGFPARP